MQYLSRPLTVSAIVLATMAAPLIPGLRPDLGAQTLTFVIVDEESTLPLGGATATVGATVAVSDEEGVVTIRGGVGVSGDIVLARLGYVTRVLALQAMTEGQVVPLTRSPIPLPGLTIGATAGPLQIGRLGSRAIESPRLETPPGGLLSDPIGSLDQLGIAARVNDFTALPVVRAGRWDQDQLLLGSVRVWAPFHGLGVSSVATPGGASGLVIGSALPGIGNVNTTGTVIAITPRLQPGGLWVRGSASLADAALSAGGSAPFGHALAWVATADRSIDSGAVGALLAGDLPFTYWSLASHLGGNLSADSRLQLSFFLSRDSTAFRAARLSEDLSSTWHSLGVGGSYVVSLSDVTSLALGLRGSRYGANVARSSREGTALGVENSLLDLEMSAQVAHDSRVGIVRGHLLATRLGTDLEDRPSRTRGLQSRSADVTVMGAGLSLDAAVGEWEWSLGARADASADQWAFQPQLEIARPIGRHWRAQAAFGRASQWVSAINADQIVPQAPLWWVHDAQFRWATSWNGSLAVLGRTGDVGRLSFETFMRRLRNLPRAATQAAVEGPVGLRAWSGGLGVDVVLPEVGPGTFHWNHTWAKATFGTDESLPPWDIRHAGQVTYGLRVGSWSPAVSWTYATGRPVPLPLGLFQGLEIDALTGDLRYTGLYMVFTDETARLPAYLRFDASMQRTMQVGRLQAEFVVRGVNLMNRSNPLFFQLGNSTLGNADGAQRYIPVPQLPRSLVAELRATWERR